MRLRALLIIVGLSLGSSACATRAEECPSTCGGCCNSAGDCNEGKLATACGLHGATCVECTGATPACSAGACVAATVDAGTP